MDFTTLNDTVNFDAATEEGKEIIRINEPDILQGLLHAAKYSNEANSTAIDIIRDEQLLFSFRIRPLSEDEYIKSRNKHTKHKKNKTFGVSMPTDTNTTKYRSQLIYTATIKEDREKVWDNKSAWDALNVINGLDLIDRVLKPGEKDRILEILDDISGYGSELGEEGPEEIAKN